MDLTDGQPMSLPAKLHAALLAEAEQDQQFEDEFTCDQFAEVLKVTRASADSRARRMVLEGRLAVRKISRDGKRVNLFKFTEDE